MEKCIFCHLDDKEVIGKYIHWTAMFDAYPVSDGHVLLVSNRHCETYFDLSTEETTDLAKAIDDIKTYLDDKYHPDGYNIGCNCGEVAGQSIKHCHIHIIPRYAGDVEDPLGGVRGVKIDKQKY